MKRQIHKHMCLRGPGGPVSEWYWRLSQGGDAQAEFEIREGISLAWWLLRETSSRQRGLPDQGYRGLEPSTCGGEGWRNGGEPRLVEDKRRWRWWEKGLGVGETLNKGVN